MDFGSSAQGARIEVTRGVGAGRGYHLPAGRGLGGAVPSQKLLFLSENGAFWWIVVFYN